MIVIVPLKAYAWLAVCALWVRRVISQNGWWLARGVQALRAAVAARWFTGTGAIKPDDIATMVPEEGAHVCTCLGLACHTFWAICPPSAVRIVPP